MSCFIIEGGEKVKGEITVQGSKNGTLPLLSAVLLTQGKNVLYGCPQLSDVTSALKILTYLGCKTEHKNGTAVIDCTDAWRCDIPDFLMREMRSSVVFLGALLARFGKAELSAPGGCEIGLRPIDLHIEAMKALGAEVNESGGRIFFACPQGLHATRITLSFPSVGATENIILASCTAKGETVIVNAAREPEIIELAHFLNRCGAKIKGAGESVIYIEGTDKLYPCEHTVEQDRIAAVTFMAAAAVTGGEIFLNGLHQGLLMPVLEPFKESGCTVKADANGVHLIAPKRLRRIKTVRTMPYPGFPTDSQADFAVMASVAEGTSVIVENIFENRFKYIAELNKMGACARAEGRVAVIEGVKRLESARVEATDLRAGSALVAAALNARGSTVVDGVAYIDRGYESLEVQLKRLGAKIKRGV
ncbi:MAG: UDP-N-acetylglucosamine 1-carboxyvinyltransferase [Clostridia bacterium]|nr:UDP-N-acetylglucosamine 1-carboxyvinyltransferase [Clostridia bacterium]